MGKICTFFGHREIWQDISGELEQTIRSAILEEKVSVFWVGGYGHFDSCAASIVSRLKTEFPHISLQLIFAYLPSGKFMIPEIYDGTIYPEGLELGPQRFAISKRNKWMVDHSDMAITYVTHRYGGAYEAYKRAKGKIPVVNLGCLNV